MPKAEGELLMALGSPLGWQGGSVDQGIIERIKLFLIQHFPATKNVSYEDPLLKNGIIDSLGILEVVTFLEKEFGFTVTDEELSPQNFESIHSLSNFVRQKTSEDVRGTTRD